MRNGKCPRCNSNEVFHKLNGVISGDKKIYVRVSMLTPGIDRDTYVCSSCGYYENYILDGNILNNIKKKWNKI